MPKEDKIVIAASDEQLQDLIYRARMKLAVANQGLPQRDWPDAIADMFRDADREGLRFQYAPVAYEVPLVDDVWNDNERYIRDFLASERCVHPERDRLIQLYFAVRHPRIARHFGR